MQKYLGSKMTIYCAVVLLIMNLGSAAFSIFFAVTFWVDGLQTEDTIVICIFVACFVVTCHTIYRAWDEMCTWGTFGTDNVKIKTLFVPERVLEYKSFKSCGIGYYHHGIYGSGVGSTIYYIYFSQYVFDDTFKNKMNLWQSSLTRVKVEFDKKLYDYLLTVLPADLSDALRRDYELYFD